MGNQGGHIQTEEEQITFVKNRYKTSLCRFVSDFGNCNRGELCQFAHEPSEQRNQGDDMSPEMIQMALESMAQSNANKK